MLQTFPIARVGRAAASQTFTASQTLNASRAFFVLLFAAMLLAVGSTTSNAADEARLDAGSAELAPAEPATVESATIEPATAETRAAVERLRSRGVRFTETQGIVTGAAVSDTSAFTDDDFRALGRITSLKTLQTSGSELNDRTLGFLVGLVALEDVSTNLAQLSDAGLKQFAAFPNLRQIKFFHTSLRSKTFNGSGFAALAGMKNLRRLTVAGCPFDDEGLAAVGQLTQLENFRTWHTYQTEAGNRHLAKLANLKSLHLGQRLRHYDGTSNAHGLSDATLDVLAAMKSLESLQLGEARLTVAALAKLQALPNLRELTLDRVDLSPGEVQRLQAALPNTKVTCEPLTAESRAALERILKP